MFNEVNKEEYCDYLYRLPKEDIKVIQSIEVDEVTTKYYDLITGKLICSNTNDKYYIYEFLDEERLGPPKKYKSITVDLNTYNLLLRLLSHEKNLSNKS